MDPSYSTEEASRRIDLTKQTDAQYWCRIFDLSMDQLREAVHHAGHQPDAVERYLREKRVAVAATRAGGPAPM